MRLFATLCSVALLAFATTSKAAIVVTDIGQKGVATGASMLQLTGVTVPAGNAILCAVLDGGAGTVGTGSIGDTVNTYVALPGTYTNNTIGQFIQIFYSLNVSALGSGTITYTKAANGIGGIACFYASGLGAIDTVVTTTAFGNGLLPTVTSPSASVSGDLFVSWAAAFTTSGTWTQNTANGWAIPFDSPAVSADRFGIGGNQVNSGTTGITFAPTPPGSINWAAEIIAFKPATTTTITHNLTTLGIGQ